MTPSVSVVMCTYNSALYIAEAIESVLTQTYKDYELIIWDDGSTDNTRNIVESFDDERIRYFYHYNTGLGMALKLACDKANGQYIARMDADDICMPERFAKEVEYLSVHKDCILVSSSVYYIDKNGDTLGRTFACSDDKVLKKTLSHSTSMIVHPMSMMRREAYHKAGGYLPIKKSEDLLFWSRLAKFGKFHNIAQPLGKYRLLGTSLDHAVNPYDNIIKAFISKMAKDPDILQSDIELFNTLYQYSKKDIRKCEFHYKTKVDEQLYNLLTHFINQKRAETIIVKIKNIYYTIKFELSRDYHK